MCRYELTTCWQNFMEIYLTRVKISPKSFRGATFLTHTVHQSHHIAADAYAETEQSAVFHTS